MNAEADVMRRRTKILAVAITATVVGGGGLVAATAASAQSFDCPRGEVCVYTDPNFNGSVLVDDLGGRVFNAYPSWINNRASSIRNPTSNWMCFYDSPNRKTPIFRVGPYRKWYSLGSANDRISSQGPC
jgi:hypothetical protein